MVLDLAVSSLGLVSNVGFRVSLNYQVLVRFHRLRSVNDQAAITAESELKPRKRRWCRPAQDNPALVENTSVTRAVESVPGQIDRATQVRANGGSCTETISLAE